MAARFWVGGGSSANWNATLPTNWSATDGGAGNASVPGASDDVIFNGNGVNANTASTVSGAITVLSLTFTAGYTNTVTINTAITLTIAGNFTDNTAHTWTVNGTGAMAISAASTITSGGKTFPGPVTFSGANTKTLSGDWTITGILLINGITIFNKTTAEVMNCGGLSGAFACSGTITIILKSGTWNTSGAMTFSELKFDGNITASTAGLAFNTGTLTYVSGTVTTTGSTLTIAASTTLNTNGITWNNITISGGTIFTLNSLLSATGTLTINNGISPSFAGSGGFTVGTFSCITTTGAAVTLTFNDGVTYTITNALNCFLSRNGSQVPFTSDHATNKAIITLQQGATCNVLASFTRIDASNGRPILSFNGTVTSCNNVFSYNDVLWKPNRGFNRGPRKKEISNRNKGVEYL